MPNHYTDRTLDHFLSSQVFSLLSQHKLKPIDNFLKKSCIFFLINHQCRGIICTETHMLFSACKLRQWSAVVKHCGLSVITPEEIVFSLSACHDFSVSACSVSLLLQSCLMNNWTHLQQCSCNYSGISKVKTCSVCDQNKCRPYWLYCGLIDRWSFLLGLLSVMDQRWMGLFVLEWGEPCSFYRDFTLVPLIESTICPPLTPEPSFSLQAGQFA